MVISLFESQIPRPRSKEGTRTDNFGVTRRERVSMHYVRSQDLQSIFSIWQSEGATSTGEARKGEINGLKPFSRGISNLSRVGFEMVPAPQNQSCYVATSVMELVMEMGDMDN